MNNKLVKRICLLLAALVIITCLTGCTSAGQSILQAFVQDYIQTKWGVNLEDTSIEGKIAAGIQLGKLATGTGNADAQAAFNTSMMLKNYAQAESLMAEGLANRDPNLMDQAIKLRPDDWSYNASRAMLAEEQGDDNAQGFYIMRADHLLKNINNTGAWVGYDTQVINEFGSFVKGSQFASTSNATKTDIYSKLYLCYQERYSVTHDFNDYYGEITYKAKYENALDGKY